MLRFAVIIAAVFALSVLMPAQIVPTSGNVFVGYSYNRAEAASTQGINLNGWNASLEGKILPHIGIVVDASGYYGSQSFASPVIPAGAPVTVNLQQYNALLGPRLSIGVGRLRPFAEALVGVSHISAPTNGFVNSDTSLAYALGGGADYRLKGPIGWRFEGDYLHTKFFSTTQSDYRVSTGIVFHF